MNIAEIKNDHSSGAEELLIHSGLLLQQEALSFSGQEPLAQLMEHFRKLGLELIQAQPRMAPMLNLVNRVLNACGAAMDSDGFLSAVDHTINQLLKTARLAKSTSLGHLETIIQNDITISTYSRSSMVINAVKELAAEQSINVICLESRPMMEGRTAARELADMNIPVTLMADAAMSSAVERADLVLVGADAFDGRFFINKIGTWPLALLCEQCQKPLYVMVSTIKYVPEIDILPPEPGKPDSELWEAPDGTNVEIYNVYFEKIPLALVNGIITEMGILRPEEMQGFDYQPNAWLWEQLR